MSGLMTMATPYWEFDQAVRHARQWSYIAGIDEVGRGPLAGPVCAAAVVLPPACDHPAIRDSKKMTEKKRVEMDAFIRENALGYAIACVDATDIDRINILQATRHAMAQAVAGLVGHIDGLLVDGMDGAFAPQYSSVKVIGGDHCSLSIAAASIIAKVYRDGLMAAFDEQYPEYGFARHKGYGTALHLQAIREYGLSPIHRRSFRIKSQE
ncbi:ribonuclease HII [Chrysiogenes arsenatis]|uniref:ribonuclease HII n=1 Tax=Chrysiogenes arsenatis TaxID=309797 RepID=UPI00040C2860|nr:ribonuclease HII [Chrysiogenes arsenatis]